MAIFLRGNIWWFEYRTRRVRVVKSTGFRKKDKAKAQAAFQAFKLGFAVKPQRSVMEKMLSAIYEDEVQEKGFPLASLWLVYEDWSKGKGRVVARNTHVNQRNLVARFVEWAAGRGLSDVSDVNVIAARDYVKTLNRSNKTIRTYCGYLSQVWEAVGQLRPGIHNPWRAATPNNDGTSVRHEAFTDEQIAAILAEASRVSKDWHLACLIALYTGLRYGDIATLDWRQIDLEAGVIKATPNKTRKSSGIEVWIPIAPALRPHLQGGEGYVLPSLGPIYPQPTDIPFSSILSAVGLVGKQYSFHSWRHTANSRMAEAGISSEVRRMICGWTNDDMARHYDHAKHLKELQEAVGAI